MATLEPRGEGAGVVAAGAALAGLAVAAGAFGAHALKDSLAADMLETYETAVRYHMYHALALLVVGRLLSRRATPLLHATLWLFVAGIILFSGSLYSLALTGEPSFGYVTPIGGLAFLAGWACLALAKLRPPRP